MIFAVTVQQDEPIGFIEREITPWGIHRYCHRIFLIFASRECAHRECLNEGSIRHHNYGSLLRPDAVRV